MVADIFIDNNVKEGVVVTSVEKNSPAEEAGIEANDIITDIVDSIYDYNLTGDSSYKYTKEEILKLVDALKKYLIRIYSFII